MDTDSLVPCQNCGADADVEDVQLVDEGVLVFLSCGHHYVFVGEEFAADDEEDTWECSHCGESVSSVDAEADCIAAVE